MAQTSGQQREAEILVLVESARQGSRTAFTQLYLLYRPFVRSVVRAHSFQHADVEGLVQETFLRAFQKMSSLRDSAKFRPWLAKVAQNVALEAGRRRMGNGCFESLQDVASLRGRSTDPLDQLYRKEKLQRLRGALQQLPDFKQQIVICTLYGLSNEETARLARRSIASIKCHKHRLRRYLWSAIQTQTRS